MSFHPSKQYQALIQALNHPLAPRWACFIIPLLFGLVSVYLGQDTNWDLQNYHLYNPYAWLNGRIGFDLAPAQMQTYFNPLLDVPYFQMIMHWPAPWVGFVMGAVHGLAFVLLVAIVRQLLPETTNEVSNRMCILLALAGCISPGFLSELGNTMGDNATALFVLASLLVLLHGWWKLGNGSWIAVWFPLLAGVLMGFGTGLKLTNAVYAMALCLACFALPFHWLTRLRIAFIFGLGVLLGFAVTAGYWHWELWQRYGNPLFPQFNSLFKSPLASQILILDTRWLPKGWEEIISWPFIFTINPERIGELEAWQIAWPVLYILFAGWVYVAWRDRHSSQAFSTSQPRSRFLLVFIALGYLIWMKLFSIQRYLVPLELLIPMAIWILIHRILQAEYARKVAVRVLMLSAFVVLLGLNTWEHKSWANTGFRVTTPPFSNPEQTTIIFAGGSPMAWMVPFFPKPIVFASVMGTFPESPAYAKQLQSILAQRSGPVFLILEAKSNFRLNAVIKMNDKFGRWGLTQFDAGCEALRWAFKKFNVHAVIQPSHRQGFQCEIRLPVEDYRNIDVENRVLTLAKSNILKGYGLQVEPDSCVEYSAFIGDHRMPYQLCRVVATAHPLQSISK